MHLQTVGTMHLDAIQYPARSRPTTLPPSSPRVIGEAIIFHVLMGEKGRRVSGDDNDFDFIVLMSEMKRKREGSYGIFRFLG